MQRLIFSLILLFSTAAQAEEIQYLSVEPQASNNSSFRDTWDSTHKFCYVDAKQGATPICLDIIGMGEIKLRDKGQWLPGAEGDSIKGELRTQAEEAYDRIFVRYLALDGTNRFVVHVFFVKKGASENQSQTIFAFGTQSTVGTNVRTELTGMSYSSPLEYLGALLGASTQVKAADANDLNAFNAAIVATNLTLLRVGQKVVETYLNGLPSPVVLLPRR